MADLKISALNSLAGADLVAADVVAVVDDSASETKKLTVSDLIANGTTLISDNTIPSAKILFAAGAIDTAELAASAVETAKINDSAVTAAKLADNSSVTLVSTLPASGDFTGQIALDTDDNKIYIWDGSAWDSVKGAGSINVVNGSTTGEINIVTSTSGDTVTISATLDDTTAAAQFLGGPTGAGGTVGYRALVGTDLPTASTTAKGGVIVNGNGLTMSSDTIAIDNTVTAETTENHIVQYDANGLITSGRAIAAADVPVATSTTIGVVKPGSGLGVTGAGELNHDNSVTAGTAAKVTFDTEGHITDTESLVAADIPDLDADKVTSGAFPTARIASDAITADKLANYTVAQISETTPTADFTSQFFFNPITRDLFLWDGNVFQPVGISAGEIVLAGTYDASTNLLDSVTADGTAAGFTNGASLPAAAAGNNRHYVVVSQSGTGSAPAPTVTLEPPDILLSNGTSYVLIETSETITAQIASNVGFTPTGNIAGTNVQAAVAEVDSEKLAKGGDTMTGDLTLNNVNIVFEGATENDYETTLTVTDPTADRTITLPNVTGTVVTTGDTGSVTSTMITDGTIVNADISASAEIAVSKLANGTARQLLQTDVAGTGVEFTSNVDVPGTLDVTGAATLDSTLAVTGATTVTGVINADGKVKFPAGTASAPSFYSGTDTNTGLYFSAADEISVATGGTQRVVVDSSGRVLVGTSSDTTGDTGAKVQIVDTGTPVLALSRNDTSITAGNTIGQIRIFSNDDSGYQECARIAAQADGTFANNDKPTRLVFSTTADGASSPSERLRIDSSGNVGIGTSSPSQPLHVNGTVLGNNYYLGVNAGTYGIASDTSIEMYGSASSQIMMFKVNGNNERMRIDSSGRLLVGTTSTSADCNAAFVGSSTSATSIIHLGRSSSVSNGSSLGAVAFGDSSQNTYAQISANADATPGASDYPGRLVFSTTADGASSPTERMRIDSAGRLGLGTSSPGYRLDVKSPGNGQFFINGQNSSGTDIFKVYESSTGDGQNGMLYLFDGAGNNDVKLSTNGASWFKGGNVGIGTTSPSTKFVVSNAGAEGVEFSHSSGTNEISSYNRSTSARAPVDIIGQTLKVLTGNPSLNTGLFQDSSGNVGIGRTSPAQNLDVASTSNIAYALDGWALAGKGDSSDILFGGILGSQFDTLKLYTSGSERMRIDSSGRLLVGTSSSSTGNSSQYAKLQVQGSTNSSTGGGIFSINLGNSGNSLVNNNYVGGLYYASTGGEFASIEARADGTCGSGDYPGRLVFSTTADGASSPTQAMLLSNDKRFYLSNTWYSNSTTANAANVHAVSNGEFYRSTSSIKYKTDVETLQDSYADAILNVRPVWYRSTCQDDNPSYGWWGFIAEEVAEVDPRLVQWKTVDVTYDEKGSPVETPCDPEPEGVAYDRFVPHLLNLIKRQGEAIAELQAEVAALKGA